MAKKILVQIPSHQQGQFFTPENRERLEELGEVYWNPHKHAFTAETLNEHIQGVHTLITTWGSAPVSDDVLAVAGDLQVVAHMAGSVKPILPTMNVFERGITVLNSNYAIGVSVSESVLAMILSLGHHIISVHDQMRSGVKWKNAAMETLELRGRTVGLVGLGFVARELIKLLQPFSCKLLAYDPFVSAQIAQEMNVQLTDLHALMKQSHIITLHAPKVPETQHMIGETELALIQDGALLINSARGDLIDQDALIRELKTGRFMAALDVYQKEPLPVDSELRSLDNVLARPHLAGVNPDSRLRIGEEMINELYRLALGQPLRFVVKKEQMPMMT